MLQATATRDSRRGVFRFVESPKCQLKNDSLSSYQNGTFAFSDPVDCSPLDTVGHSCARGTDNDVGFYECEHYSSLCTVISEISLASSWEYSFFAPHSMATIVELMGGNETSINRTYVNLFDSRPNTKPSCSSRIDNITSQRVTSWLETSHLSLCLSHSITAIGRIYRRFRFEGCLHGL